MKKQLAFSIVFIIVGIIGLVAALVYGHYQVAVVIAFTTGFNLAMPLAHAANQTAKESVELADEAWMALADKSAECAYWKKEALGDRYPHDSRWQVGN